MGSYYPISQMKKWRPKNKFLFSLNILQPPISAADDSSLAFSFPQHLGVSVAEILGDGGRC